MKTLIDEWESLSDEVQKLDEEYICGQGKGAAAIYCKLEKKTEEMNELFCKICMAPCCDSHEGKRHLQIALEFYDFGDDDTGIGMKNLTTKLLKFL